MKLVKQMKEKLDFQAVLDGIDDGIFVSDAKGTILMVNRSVERTGNKKTEELIGRNIDDLVAEGYCSEFATKRVLTTKKKSSIIQKLPDGREFVVTAIPYFENGKISMVVACERDITELVSLQKKLSESETLKARYEEELKKLKENRPLLKMPGCVSDAMVKTMELARKLAPIDSTVLIQGESGSGKELIAEYIQGQSPRKGRPFIKINCGAIPENLLESELFGYVGGAFTGALKGGRAGYFEAANNGTLFLDEIGELPVRLQVKLLRVLQERKLTRVGGTRELDLNVRILAATNRNLRDMVREGLFRQDLYYRLNVTTIRVPPLRERKADIIELSKFFLDKYNQKYEMKRKLSSRGLNLLLRYQWPGNVRELENLLESLVITSESNWISPAEIASYLQDDFPDISSETIAGEGTLQARMERFEKKLLSEAWKAFGNTAIMASRLGTTRSTVNRKLQKYGLR